MSYAHTKSLLLTSVTIAAFAISLVSHACDKREPTPEASPGPHDYSLPPAPTPLWREGDRGEPLYLKARVLDTCGRAVREAQVQILHGNADGYHEPDRWRTLLKTDESGEFKVITVYPGYVGDIPRHIHFAISHPAYHRLITRVYFKNDPEFHRNIEQMAIVLEEITREGKRGWVAGHEFVLRSR